jgi:hypothetical protein
MIEQTKGSENKDIEKFQVRLKTKLQITLPYLILQPIVTQKKILLISFPQRLDNKKKIH